MMLCIIAEMQGRIFGFKFLQLTAANLLNGFIIEQRTSGRMGRTVGKKFINRCKQAEVAGSKGKFNIKNLAPVGSQPEKTL